MPVAYASVLAVQVPSRRRTFPYNSICTVSVDRPEHKALFSNTFSGIDTVASLFLSGSETGFLDRGSLVLRSMLDRGASCILQKHAASNQAQAVHSCGVGRERKERRDAVRCTRSAEFTTWSCDGLRWAMSTVRRSDLPAQCWASISVASFEGQDGPALGQMPHLSHI